MFHSVPYAQKSKNSLEWWEYDKLGTSASLGCVRLSVADAKWIYDNCVSGTMVEFYQDASPGPLGKPTAQKIGEQEAVRDWDPTDPDVNNPWKNYTPVEPTDNNQEPEVKPEPPEENKVEQNNTVVPENNQSQDNNVVEEKNNNVMQDNTVTNNNTQDNNEAIDTNVVQVN